MKTTVASEASTMISLLCLSFLCGTNAFIVKPSTISAGAARFVRASSQPRIADKKIMRAQLRMAVAIPSTIATRSTDSVTDSVAIDLEGVHLSGLNGLALKPKTFPTKREVIDVVPKHCFVKDTWRSMKYAAISVSMTLAIGALAAVFLPLKLAMLPAWIAYSIVCGTVATGAWVVAHECGHGAFSDNKTLQDSVGFVLHSALIVPYFSWQRSHAVHHANTNHMENGETHVPEVASASGLAKQREISHKIFGKELGTVVFGAMSVFNHLVVGWPAYLLFGATGGPSRGMTSHFFPHPPFSTGEKATDLYPGKWKQKVWLSNAGIAATLFALAAWTAKAGIIRVAALYGGPLLVVNSWLVLITWLQHTEVDVPHFDAANWNFIKGALHTVDRPYGRVLDFLHHRIGSTHVAHHVDCTIPHYHALEATNAIKEAFPEHYLYDPTPLPQATWRLATQCVGVEKRGDMHVFVN